MEIQQTSIKISITPKQFNYIALKLHHFVILVHGTFKLNFFNNGTKNACQFISLLIYDCELTRHTTIKLKYIIQMEKKSSNAEK